MGHHHPGMNQATLRPPRPVHLNGWASLQVPHDQTALAGLPIARRRISIMRVRELCRYIYSVTHPLSPKVCYMFLFSRSYGLVSLSC